MKTLFSGAGRVVATLVILLLAVAVGAELWNYYTREPWTRDAHVRADVVSIASDVSGPVSEVLVRDNQTVEAGDVLFRIDQERFELNLRQASAAVQSAEATMKQAQHDLDRYQHLDNAVARQTVEQARTRLETARAARQTAQAEQALAQLNLTRSAVRASSNGVLTNVTLQEGDYVTAGQPVLALVNSDSLRVEGYFEETKLARIHVGAKVDIRLMGQKGILRGHVESIAAAIADRERAIGSSMLADINPTFTWVRLAQRVPVRIALDEVPEHVFLIAGQTATVKIHPQG